MREFHLLHPEVQDRAREAMTLLQARKLDILITCTYRSWIEQAAEYAKGRTVLNGRPTSKFPMGPVVTRARPGQSWHNWGRALDFVPRRNGKTLVWGTKGNGLDQDPSDDATDDLELWQRCAACFQEVGFSWAGNWETFREYPHVELTGGHTIKELLSKYPRGLKPGEFV